MNEVLQKISAIGIVPVIKIDDVEKLFRWLRLCVMAVCPAQK